MAYLERIEVAIYVFARNSPFPFRRGRLCVGLLDLLCDPEEKDVISSSNGCQSSRSGNTAESNRQKSAESTHPIRYNRNRAEKPKRHQSGGVFHLDRQTGP
jgi:hypothetical protein